ncbi:MAG: glycosyltransferase family 4 protein [Candidatus Bathyarchaeia archaeon]
MDKLKLAIFNTQPPHICCGGVERRIIELGKRLLNKNIDITVYSGTKSGFRNIAMVDGIKIVPCFSTDMFFPIDNWFFNKSVLWISRKNEADIYEAHTVSGYRVARFLHDREMRSKPFIQVIHGVLADEYLESFKEQPMTARTKLAKLFLPHLSKLEKESAEKATLIVTISKYSFKKIVQLYGIDREKIRIVPNGVDAQKFKPDFISRMQTKREMKLKEDEKYVLFVGNLVPRKGLYLLINAAKKVFAEIKNVKVLIAGTGPLRNSLLRYAETKGVLDRIIFLGQVKDEILPKLYNCCDVVVLPSLQEGQGIALLEAQAAAKPVVACRVGGVPEIVLDGETGILVQPREEELAMAMIKLLSDDNLREKMGMAGRRFVCENFTWEKCAEKMLNVYYEAINQGLTKTNS